MSESTSTVNTITVAVGDAEPITLRVGGPEPAVIRLEVADNACCHHPHSATQPGSYTYTEQAARKS
ncbi:hypothetical protein [Pseudarthrobacter cellobiosi]|uniref:hypothetical protein n=1 Tax=Pseudarthrobacter cellobiosi TaxID=2953654 RepID=UPI00208E45B6|nr:hypothetical protein [Pseudarthrobacter sp. HLT1-5]MCO4256053.1 hypothetical protein [Pseudarthrobacter sp. HLT1-5]